MTFWNPRKTELKARYETDNLGGIHVKKIAIAFNT